MILTITGTNDFARRAELTAKVAAFEAEHGKMATERYDGEETPASRMQEAVQSISFLSPNKLVVLYGAGKQKAFADTIDVFLDRVADTTEVILEEPKLDKRLSYYKTLKKRTEFKDCPELDPIGLQKWATGYVSEHSGVLSPGDAKMLIGRTGLNQQMLKSELDKLLAYSPKITSENIVLLTELLPQSTIFELLDAAFRGDTARMFELYKEQRALKIEPQAIIAMLGWQLHVLAVIKTGEGRSVDEIAKESRLNPFVVRKTQTVARQLSMAHLRQLISWLLQLDMQLKRSAINADDALQLYLLKLAQK